MANPGEDARTREMVGRSVQAVRNEAARGGSPGAGHAVDARMDAIASQAAFSGGGDLLDAASRAHSTQIRDTIDRNHRREMQLAAMSRAAKQGLGEPGSAIGTGINLGTREQATGEASRAPASAASRRPDPGGRHVLAATVQRAVSAARNRSRGTTAAATPARRATAAAARTARAVTVDRRPMRALEHGGHRDVPVPPPRPPAPRIHTNPARTQARGHDR